ncbi:unnamed protein product [Thelazia callipaeda]|uniref:MARVEL domain-containing protein n=1 Tax=Thelazia callipaeda TaxID=103827 RepID=A0A0N5CUV1_THECL|nr:unnamed protein product [Thelazia callipaeda]
MDFNPNHPKWICCCCHLTNGLMTLAAFEIFVSFLLSLYSCIFIFIPNEQRVHTPWFLIILTSVAVIYAIASASLIAGIHLYKEIYMYPTLAARTILVLFMQAFGVSTVVKPTNPISAGGNINGWSKSALQNNINHRKKDESSTAQRLFLLAIFMLITSIFVFYTIYLVVRCIHYIKAHQRLMLRRNSMAIASQIA